MIVITLTSSPPYLRGYLTRWLFEISGGVYVGYVTARVRDHLWDRVRQNIGSGKAIMVYSAHCEQGIAFKLIGYDWEPVDYDGLTLLRKPDKAAENQSDIGLSHEKYHSSELTKKDFPVPPDFCILNCETTGLEPDTDLIIEVGILKVRNYQIDDIFSSLVFIERELPQMTKNLTHLTDEELFYHGMQEKWVLESAEEILENDLILGYNISFDLSFLRTAYERQGIKPLANKSLDLLSLVRRHIKGVEDYKISTVAECLGLKFPQSHRAKSGCFLIFSVLDKLKKIAENCVEDPFK